MPLVILLLITGQVSVYCSFEGPYLDLLVVEEANISEKTNPAQSRVLEKGVIAAMGPVIFPHRNLCRRCSIGRGGIAKRGLAWARAMKAPG